MSRRDVYLSRLLAPSSGLLTRAAARPPTLAAVSEEPCVDFDEIAEILGAETVARMNEAVRSAFVVARGHPDAALAEAALDRLLVILLGAVMAHPHGLATAPRRVEDFCRELELAVAEARRLASAGNRARAEPADEPPSRRRRPRRRPN